MVTLLERNQGLATIADVDGIQLAGPDIEVLSVAWAPGPSFTFTIRAAFCLSLSANPKQ